MLIGRTVLAEAATHFLAALAAMTAMAFFILSVTFLKRTPGVGMSFLVEVFPLFFPLALQFTVPLATLSASVLTFGRMTDDGELTALAAAGVPLRATVLPALAGAAAVSLCALLLFELAAPFAASRLRDAKHDILTQLQTSFRAGLRNLDLGRGHLSFESYKDGKFQDLCIEFRDESGGLRIFRAREGTLAVGDADRIYVHLNDQRASVSAKGRDVRVSVGESAFDVPIGHILGADADRRKESGMRAWELAYLAERDLPAGPEWRTTGRKAAQEIAQRTALSASAFFFALAGIPLGILGSRGGRVAAFLTAVAPVLLLYFPLVIGGSQLARSGDLPAYPALWTGNAVLGVLGILLLRRVARR